MLDWLPKHKCGLYLTHNEHRDSYEPVEQAAHRLEDDDWVTPDEREKAIETDSIWTLQWYPETPIGFFIMAASSLEALEAYFRKEVSDAGD